MAFDKRQDLLPGLVNYWTLKLADYPDQQVCEVLLAYSGELFPSVDDVIDLIVERRQQEFAKEQLASTEAYRADMHRAWMMSKEEAEAYDRQVQEIKQSYEECLKKMPVVSRVVEETRVYQADPGRRELLKRQAKLLAEGS